MSAFDTVQMLSGIILHTRLLSPLPLQPALSARSYEPPREAVSALCPAQGLVSAKAANRALHLF